VQDYLRRSSAWHDVSRNIQEFQQVHPHNINIHVTVQALNLLHLPQLLEWCQQHQLPVTFGQVQEPAYLSLEAMPEQLRCQSDLESYQAQVQGLAQHVSQTRHQPRLLQQLRQFLDWYDPGQDWRTIIPEWQPYLS